MSFWWWSGESAGQRDKKGEGGGVTMSPSTFGHGRAWMCSTTAAARQLRLALLAVPKEGWSGGEAEGVSRGRQVQPRVGLNGGGGEHGHGEREGD